MQAALVASSSSAVSSAAAAGPRIRGPALAPSRRQQQQQSRPVSVSALRDPVVIPSEFTKLTPRGEYVLCAVAEIETKTTSGVMLPTSAQRVPTSGDVVALGDGLGAAGEFGATPRQFELKPGDTVLYSKFGLGCTDVTLGGQPHILLRESDVIGTMPRSGATASDVPKLKPLGDRVLLKVQPAADVTAGGVVLPDSAKEKPIAGVVVAVGPGKRAGDRGGPKGADKDAADPNARLPPKVKEGDRVLYFKWAGDQMETPEGEQYVVLHESDILCKQG